MESNRDTLTGRVMSQWWDECAEAGPKARPASQFSEQPPSLDVLAMVNNELVNFGSKFVGAIIVDAPKKRLVQYTPDLVVVCGSIADIVA